jgi:predicted ATPase
VTLWGLTIYQKEGERLCAGSIKILQRNPEHPSEAIGSTILPKNFTKLDENYCSLCQSLEFYEKLRDAGSAIYKPFLAAIRDIATSPENAKPFEGMEGFQNSLLRFSEAEKAYHEAKTLFEGGKSLQSYTFHFQCTVPGASAKHDVHLDFSEHPTGLHRTAVIIGRNGTGKTQFLAQFALAMSGIGDDTIKNDHRFVPNRPSFSRVIAVSYSVFDDFLRPSSDFDEDRTFSYKYCGIRSSSVAEGVKGAQILSPTELLKLLTTAATIVTSDKREKIWQDILGILLEGTIAPDRLKLDDLSFYDRLSSGQKILVATMTQIVAHIKRQSVILFDEPELHLHPEILAALARAIDRLLREFDSYAIIATHSALLLQETLSRQVRIFRRAGDIPRVDQLTVESFGENLTTISREVFAMDGDKNNFRAILEALSENRTPTAVEEMFPLGLPLQAQAYLQALQQTKSQ